MLPQNYLDFLYFFMTRRLHPSAVSTLEEEIGVEVGVEVSLDGFERDLEEVEGIDFFFGFLVTLDSRLKALRNISPPLVISYYLI